MRNFRFPTLNQPLVGNAAVHDPKMFGRGYSPDIQRDTEIMESMREQVARGLIPIDAIVDLINARGLPPQLVQTVYPGVLTAVGTPIILMPKNLRRQSLKIANFLPPVALPNTNVLLFSYDAPLQIANAGANAQFAGIPIPPSTSEGESNGSVSINDIWVWCNDAAATYPMFVLGFEGTLSIAGNKAAK